MMSGPHDASMNAQTENPSGQGLLADDTEQFIVFYNSISFSQIYRVPASCLTETVREDRGRLEIMFVYIVADKVGVPYAWINLQLPEQLVHRLRIGCEIQVGCTITHPLIDIYEYSGTVHEHSGTAFGFCDVCGDINRGDRRWHYNIDSCTECETFELCCLCRVVLPRASYTFPYTEQNTLCLRCISTFRHEEDSDHIYCLTEQLSASQETRLSVIDRYWDYLYENEFDEAGVAIT